MATLTERLAIQIEANAGQALASFKQVGTAAKGLSGDVGKAGGALANLGGSLGGLFGESGALGSTAGLLAAGTAVAKFVTDGISGFVNLAGQVTNFRRIAGGTPEDASKMVAAFKAVGIDADTAANGIFQLEKHLASGADKLATFGVTAVKDAKGNTDMSATVLNVAAAYQKIQDPVQKAALLTAAFGRQGTALIPLLSKSRAEIEAFFGEADKDHKILSQKDLDDVKAYNLAMRNLKEAVSGLEEEAGKALVPFLTDLAATSTDVLHLTDQIGGLISKIHDVPGVPLLEKLIGNPSISWLNPITLGQAAVDHFNQTNSAGTTIATGFADELNSVASAIGLVGTAADGVGDLDKALTAATDADHALASAHQSTIDAQAAYNKLLKDGAVDLDKVTAAQTSLDEAVRSAGHSQREQAKAQGEYNKALAAYNSLPTDTNAQKLADAKNNLADANDSVADATDRVKSSQKELAAAKAGDPEYQSKLAKAKQAVADATDNESKKALADVTARAAETQALTDNADAVQNLFNWYKQLIAQHPEVAAALAGNLAALGPALAPAPAAGPLPGSAASKPGIAQAAAGVAGVLPKGPPAPPAPSGPQLPTQPARGPVTINNTINTPMDPGQLAQRILWGL